MKFLAVVTAIFGLYHLAISHSWALSTDKMPKSDNVEVQGTDRCPNRENSLTRVQEYVIGKASDPEWADLKMIFILSDATVKQVLGFVLEMPTLTMAPRLREVVEADTHQIMIVYAASRPRAIVVFLDKTDCVLSSGPVETETVDAMLTVLEVPH